MAMKIARTLLASDTSVDTVDRAERLFSYISSIIKDLPGADEETDEDVSTLPIWDCVQLAALVHHYQLLLQHACTISLVARCAPARRHGLASLTVGSGLWMHTAN